MNMLQTAAKGIFRRTVTAVDAQICLSPAMNLHTSVVLCGEPMKKKRRQDPALVKIQVDRRRKRLEKQIRLASRFGRKLKPVDEFELHREVPKDSRPRKVEAEVEMREEQTRRLELRREWSIYKSKQSKKIYYKFADMIKAQEVALSELKLESPVLYNLAVDKDTDILPYKFMGPSETPPIAGYIQDGNYTETTKSYELNPEIVKLMLGKNEIMSRRKK